MDWTCYIPSPVRLPQYSWLRPHLDHLTAVQRGADPADPSCPEACRRFSAGACPPPAFFAGEAAFYIRRALHPTQTSGWPRRPDSFADLPAMLRATDGHVLIRGGLGKTLALQHALWTHLTAGADNRLGAYLPCWVTPALAADLAAWPQHGPPVLFFVDLDALPEPLRAPTVAALRESTGRAGSGHRLVFAYRAWAPRATDPLADTLGRLAAWVLEVQPLTAAEAAQEWAARGVPLALIHELSGDLRARSAAASPPLPAHNVPRALTSFVGRSDLLSRVIGALDQHALVTLQGPGGVGKTRVAREVADRLVTQFADGIGWVDLAGVSQPALIAGKIVEALHLQEQGKATALQVLIAALAARQLLLVLDNCEHLRPACADLIGQVLAACPQVTILTTSRCALQMGAAECVVTVRPLILPPPRARTLAEVQASEAGRLFSERVAASRPARPLRDADAPAVARLCRRLGGLPLAIEVVAAQARRFDPVRLLQLLDQAGRSLQLRGPRGGAARQRTLYTTLEWSYRLLDPAAQALFRRLAVCAGGADATAATAVGGPELAPANPTLLTTLVDHALITAAPAGEGLTYRLLEPVRRYGLEKLAAAGEEMISRERHLAWCQQLVAAADTDLRGAAQQQRVAQLARESDNFRAALTWGLAHRPAAAIPLAATLWRFWYIRAAFSEGRRWLRAARRALWQFDPPRERDPGPPPAIVARLLLGAGMLAYEQGVYPAATRLLLACQRAQGQGPEATHAWLGRGLIALRQGRLARARRLLVLALELWQQAGDQHGMSLALLNLGLVAAQTGDEPAAATYYQESLALCRAGGDLYGMAHALHQLALLACGHDYAAAAAAAQEALALRRLLGDRRGISATINTLGMIALDRGAYDEATALFQESLALKVQVGDTYGQAIVRYNLGEAALGRGDDAEAVARYRAALAFFEQIDDRWGQALVWGGLGRAAHLIGDHATARRYYTDCCARWASLHNLRGLAEIRHHLGQQDLRDGDLRAAGAYWRAALTAAEAVGAHRPLARTLSGILTWAVAAGHYTAAARLGGAVAALLARLGVVLGPLDQPAYARLAAAPPTGADPVAWTAAWQAGMGDPLAAAISLAYTLLPPEDVQKEPNACL